MNQLMSDEAVYRTAPATPGLLTMFMHTHSSRMNAEPADVAVSKSEFNLCSLLRIYIFHNHIDLLTEGRQSQMQLHTHQGFKFSHNQISQQNWVH